MEKNTSTTLLEQRRLILTDFLTEMDLFYSKDQNKNLFNNNDLDFSENNVKLKLNLFCDFLEISEGFLNLSDEELLKFKEIIPEFNNYYQSSNLEFIGFSNIIPVITVEHIYNYYIPYLTVLSQNNELNNNIEKDIDKILEESISLNVIKSNIPLFSLKEILQSDLFKDSFPLVSYFNYLFYKV